MTRFITATLVASAFAVRLTAGPIDTGGFTGGIHPSELIPFGPVTIEGGLVKDIPQGFPGDGFPIELPELPFPEDGYYPVDECGDYCGNIPDIPPSEAPPDAPEPGTWLLTGAGLGAVAVYRRKQQ
ncbi:MAG: PEP-CTERM sorting domain-containing protein [Acidobacteria bacterium]|nr:PEP-CTERM sorting domain-containing protein [Acidobacteriota bacterium]